MTVSCVSQGEDGKDCTQTSLECDSGSENIDTIWCTNGTVISRSNVVCDSASLLPSKSVLNCVLKVPNADGQESTTLKPTLINVLPLPNRSNLNQTGANEEFVLDYTDSNEEDSFDLVPQVKTAMKNVFPHELLAMTSNRYLPPKASMQSLDSNLKDHINGVFDANLLALSNVNNGQEVEENTDIYEETTPFPSISNGNLREQANTNWNYNANRYSGNVDASKSTFSTRFDGDSQSRGNLRDRLIFTD